MHRDEIQEIRAQILQELLTTLPFPGWAEEPLKHAASKAGYTANMAFAVFPAGTRDALDAFADFIDTEMLKRLAPVDAAALPVRERISLAVLARFEALESYRDAEREAAHYWASPFRKLSAGKILWRTADRIWNWAGDTSDDYNHYTKRFLLSGVIASTLLAWLDKEREKENIKAFLDRRIENVMQLNKMIAPFKKKA